MAGTIDQQIALGAVDDAQALPLVGKLHEWVVTVDHKRLGLMYIGTGLLFFIIAGIMASVMRLQLAFPNQHVVAPEFQAVNASTASRTGGAHGVEPAVDVDDLA